MFIRYKHIILDLIGKNYIFYKVTVNDHANHYNDSFFNKYWVEIPKLADKPMRHSTYFEKFEDFTSEDLKEYKET